MPARTRGHILLAHGPGRPSPLLRWTTGPPPALSVQVPLTTPWRALQGAPPHVEAGGATWRADDSWAVIHQPAPDGLSARW